MRDRDASRGTAGAWRDTMPLWVAARFNAAGQGGQPDTLVRSDIRVQDIPASRATQHNARPGNRETAMNGAISIMVSVRHGITRHDSETVA